MAYIVTGYIGRVHVTSQDDAAFQKIVGTGDYFIKQKSDTENPMAVETTAGTIQLPEMDLIQQGVHSRIEGSETVTLELGTQGTYRTDIICGKYSKSVVDYKEEFTIEVVKGTPATSSPSEPTITKGDISDGETHYTPLFAVTMYGNNVQSIVRKIAPIKNMAEISDWLNKNQNSLNGLASSIAKINANAADIATNKANISTNKANISTNKTNISTNKSDISTNRTNISANTSAIAKKTGTGDFVRASVKAENVSISGNTYHVQAFNIAKSGYKALAVAGFAVNNASSGGTGANKCRVIVNNITSDTSATMHVMNESSSAAKVNLVIDVLYVKNL